MVNTNTNTNTWFHKVFNYTANIHICMSYHSHCKHKYVVSYHEFCNGHLLYDLNFQPIHLMWLYMKKGQLSE
jgi:hypothetical protein